MVGRQVASVGPSAAEGKLPFSAGFHSVSKKGSHTGFCFNIGEGLPPTQAGDSPGDPLFGGGVNFESKNRCFLPKIAK